MKKILLSLTFTVALVFANAQCTPDPQFTAAGIYPDSATGLSPAYVGQSYSEVITVITPLDTNTIYNGTLIDVTVSTITLASLTGLPSNFTYACDPPSCSFPGGTTSCAVLTSTSNPTMADVGSYQLMMTTETDGMGTVGPVTIPLPTQTDVIDYYYLDIVDMVNSTINQFDNTTFELKGVYPNPVTDQAKIQFVLGTSGLTILKVYNLLGKEIKSIIMDSNRGVNTININTSSYSDGMYLYSINNGTQVLTNRMVIKK
ncbi:MAG: hypothetical protein CMD16_04660 [Flavobacteriales bacterium]|mgnify:FL=1|nr:hypothetical protein [Flavobacteriales bacterium]|tara:strand:- start:10483 stop:11259 length:777 start_codon:yes stop_codon:yes gene_type:complete